MQKFLAIYIGTMEAFEKTGWNKLDPRKRKELEQSGMQAWIAWGTANAAATVDQGNPLGSSCRLAVSAVQRTPTRDLKKLQSLVEIELSPSTKDTGLQFV